jgi:secreted trypsin-like serine protease
MAGLAVSAVAAAPAGAVVLSDGASDTDSRALANSFEYSSVGQIFETTGSGNFTASGVMIAPGWVLTAAHVTAAATSLTFYTDGGSTDFSASRTGGIAADAWYTNPAFTGVGTDGGDIALIHLGNMPACFAAAACQTATIYTGASELNKLATMIGYGHTGTGSTGATAFDGLKRSGSNTVNQIYGASNDILLADFDSGSSADNATGSRTPVTNEAIIASGDSGGGLFEIIGGIEYLVGITSFIAAPLDGIIDSDYGDVAGWTRVSSYASWIDSTIAANTPLPEPAGIALFGAGLAGLGFLRRRKAG